MDQEKLVKELELRYAKAVEAVEVLREALERAREDPETQKERGRKIDAEERIRKAAWWAALWTDA